jgi:hypothetical protein
MVFLISIIVGFQVIAHHPMQSISFASGGDTVSPVSLPPCLVVSNMTGPLWQDWQMALV